MNIFYLHHCPRTAARYHCDKHVVKMVLEYAQLLCTAHHTARTPTLPPSSTLSLYKPTHRNHPSAIWVRQSPAHYRWLYALLTHLLEEYTHRYSRIHSTARLLPILAHASSFTQTHFDQPPQAMPPAYHSTTSSIKAYRRYYKNDKIHFAKYTKRTTPHWLTPPPTLETHNERTPH